MPLLEYLTDVLAAAPSALCAFMAIARRDGIEVKRLSSIDNPEPFRAGGNDFGAILGAVAIQE
jgi:hypothetical protein